jgi:hypothetical protein
VQNTFSNSNSTVSVNYLMTPNYYIQIKTTGTIYINVYTTITGYLAVAWGLLTVKITINPDKEIWLYQADTDNDWNNHMIKYLQS